MLAIRISALSRFVGPEVEFDGATRPREAWRTLLRIAGITVRGVADGNTQRTTTVGGYALRDVSLDIEHGSVVCLAGPSGSGKSTLLQILAGRIAPTSGRAEIHGSRSSLLTIGGDLDANASTRDNIVASTQYQEMSAADRVRYFEDVLDFAELRDFEHASLRTLSTGMKLRLNVALVMCGRSAIMLLDDVMAVGDIAFQQKCVERVRELAEQGRTIVAVFDDDEFVQQLATRIVTLAGGAVVSDSAAGHWGSHVTSGSAADVSWDVIADLPEDDAMALTALAVAAGRDGDASYIDLAMSFQAKANQVRCRPSVVLNRGEMGLFRTLAPQFLTLARGHRPTWTVRIPTHTLSDGTYSLMVNMQSQRGDAVYAIKAHEAVTLTVRREPGQEADDGGREAPLLVVQFPWEIEPLESGI